MLWDDYDPSVKVRIDDLEIGRDCVGLQAEFDTAYENDASTRERTGHGNADLMIYIDEALRAAGCY